MEEIERASHPDSRPFDAWTEDAHPAAARRRGDVVGLSVCFPGQLQPAYAMAHAIKRALPDVHVTCGGPGITQMMIRLSGQRLARALGPFDSACVYEGEHTLLGLVRALEEKASSASAPTSSSATTHGRALAGGPRHGGLEGRSRP